MELLLTNPGTTVSVKSGKIEIKRDGALLGKHPANTISSLICLPGVHPNESVISTISSNGGKIVFLSAAGKIKSTLVGAGDVGNVQTRIQQFTAFGDNGICLDLSRSIVKAKIHNMDRFSREFTGSIHENLRQLKHTATHVDGIHALRGVEGLAARIYFSELRKRIPPYYRSDKRVKRFALDPLNQIQSFVYSLLHHSMIGLIYGAGLDPYLGFYHQPGYNHAALASDLMENYRAQICDRVILRVFKTSHFVEELVANETPEKGLGSEVLAILRKSYVQRLEDVVSQEGEEKSFLRLMHGDVFGLRKVLNGEQSHFLPWRSS